MRYPDLGRTLFALALVILGVLSLYSGDFASVWQPVPAHVFGRTYLAIMSGGIMVVGGIGLLVERTRVPAAFLVMLYTLLWLLALHVPRVMANPLHEITWGGCAEIAILVAGSWMLYLEAASPGRTPYIAPLAGSRAIRMARLLFALALPLIGLEHFVYAQPTADMVPAWLPAHMTWAYLTGAAHIAAGMAIMLGVFSRLAAMLEAVMMGVFTAFVWIPSVAGTPGQRFAWTGLVISTVITAAAWIMAASYRDAPWVSAPRPQRRQADLLPR